MQPHAAGHRVGVSVPCFGTRVADTSSLAYVRSSRDTSGLSQVEGDTEMPQKGEDGGVFLWEVAFLSHSRRVDSRASAPGGLPAFSCGDSRA